MKRLNSILSIIVFFGLIGCESITPLNGDKSSKNSIANTDSIGGSSDEKIKKIYSNCAGCHGTNGEKAALGKSQKIGGEDKDALFYELKEYRAGRLNQYGMGPLMKGQVAGFSDSGLELLAEYISRLPGY